MSIEAYIKAFSSLRTDKAASRWSEDTKHRAPHKPLLLMSVLDLFAQGVINANLIEPNLELSEVFNLYWAKVMPPDTNGNLALPFYHLQSDNFWHLLPRPGYEQTLKSQVRSVIQLREFTFGATLDDELYEILQSEKDRNTLQTVLISTYFASDDLRRRLQTQSSINLDAYQYSKQLLEQARKREPLIFEDVQEPVRDQGFRRAVVAAYDHRCAFCGVRVLTPINHTAVEAAHIIPWSYSHNDNPNNGLALCKLCHWSFDEGMVSVSGKYKILVSPQLNTNDNIAGHMGTLSRRDLILPIDEVFYPEPDYLAWHRRERFYHH